MPSLSNLSELNTLTVVLSVTLFFLILCLWIFYLKTQNIRQKLTRTTLALAAADIGTWEWNISQDTITFDRKWLDQLGYHDQPDTSPLIEHESYLYPANRDTFDEFTATLNDLANDRYDSFEKEYPLVDNLGNSRWMLGRGKITDRDSKGKPLRVSGTNLDITQKKKLEERSKIKEQEYSSILTAIADGFFLIDSVGNFTEVNPAFCLMTGYSEKELLRMSIADLELIVDQECITQRIKFATAKGSDHFESIYTCKDGRQIDVEINTTHFNDLNGRICVFIRDITEKKRLEHALLQSQKLETIGTLAGGIAHDFNNILSAIIGRTELAKLHTDSRNKLEEDLDGILSSGSRASELIQQILTFSRPTDSECVTISPLSLTKETLKMLRSIIPANIEIQESSSIQGVYLRADPVKINQILINLCINAFHALEDSGGKIHINLSEVEQNNQNQHSGRYLCMSVADDGPGIDKKNQERIFDPFFTTKEEGKGTGLGLSMVHSIVKSYDGFITLESQKGKGCTFNIFLPIEEQDEPSQELAVDRKEPLTGSERILYVDDDEIVAKIAKEILETLGYKVTVVIDSKNALELFSCNPQSFDLVISDQTMPNITGAALAERMFSIRPDIPFILTTGYSATVSEEQAKRLGIKAYVHKPFRANTISKVIRNALSSENSQTAST